VAGGAIDLHESTLSGNVSLAEQLAATEAAALLKEFPSERKQNLPTDWSFWARRDQWPPEGSWQTWLVMAGRGFGKTEFIRLAIDVGYRRVALVAPTAADVRDVMVEGQSGILGIYPDAERPLYEPSKRRITWACGAVATTYSADEPERFHNVENSPLREVI
jgi:phage terminase large subunit-like protein